jgi:hypothetical protein
MASATNNGDMQALLNSINHLAQQVENIGQQISILICHTNDNWLSLIHLP